MCQSKHSGGRRCDETPAKRKAHNRRRRVNNGIKKSVTNWAEENASRGESVELLNAPPGQVKQWALDNNVPFKVLADNVDKPEAVSDIASNMHDDWREARRNEDGTYEPRLKDDGNGGEVDIANTSYSDLPEKWQAENKASAESAVEAVLNNDANIDAAAEQIHKDWLSRNGEWAPEDQKLPYAELSEDEKEKDRVVARAAAARLGLKYPEMSEADLAASVQEKFADGNMDDLTPAEQQAWVNSKKESHVPKAYEAPKAEKPSYEIYDRDDVYAEKMQAAEQAKEYERMHGFDERAERDERAEQNARAEYDPDLNYNAMAQDMGMDEDEPDQAMMARDMGMDDGDENVPTSNVKTREGFANVLASAAAKRGKGEELNETEAKVFQDQVLLLSAFSKHAEGNFNLTPEENRAWQESGARNAQ